jgi:myo-inositol-1(or 4)-monophosphatase
MNTLIDILRLHEQVEPLMREVGRFQLSLFRSDNLNVQTKADGSYVCNADLHSEQMLKQGLYNLFPQAGFFAEESGQSGQSHYQWVIDPLDGTTNYIRGIPYFAISVALTYNGNSIWGAIFNPVANDFFYAVKDNGAYCNGKRLVLNQVANLNKTLIIVGFPYLKQAGYKNILDHLPQIALNLYAFRYLGAVALDQAYLACGAADGLLFCQLGWWDVAAGMLLITEAGGKVSDFQGNLIDQRYQSFVAGGVEIHRALLDILKNGSS